MVEKLKERVLNPFFIAAFLFAVVVYGGLLPLKEKESYSGILPYEDVFSVSGTVISNPVLNSSRRYYSFRLDLERVEGEIARASVSSDAKGTLNCLIKSEIVEAIYPGKLYSGYGNGILVETGEKLVLYGRSGGGFFICSRAEQLQLPLTAAGTLNHFRALCRLQFKRLMYGWKDAGGFILALLSGSREYTDRKLSDDFRKAGLSHILALSGMHLSFFSTLSAGLFSKISGKKFSSWIQLFGILGFVWFAGLSPSLLRALLCSLIMMLCKSVFSLNADNFIILCSVFLIHCLVAPWDMFSAAFLLSYGALAGILLLSDVLDSKLGAMVPHSISSSLSASVSAQAATSPICLLFFRTLTPVGIPASLVVSPVVNLFMTLSVFSISICLLMPFLSPVFCFIMNLIYKIISFLVGMFSCIPPVVF